MWTLKFEPRDGVFWLSSILITRQPTSFEKKRETNKMNRSLPFGTLLFPERSEDILNGRETRNWWFSRVFLLLKDAVRWHSSWLTFGKQQQQLKLVFTFLESECRVSSDWCSSIYYIDMPWMIKHPLMFLISKPNFNLCTLIKLVVHRSVNNCSW